MRYLKYAAVVAATLSAPAARAALFDFENAPIYTPLPINLTVDGITASFFATGQGSSIQRADTMGFTPAGFSGNCIYPSSVFLSDLHIGFSTSLSDFSILYAPQELACDSSATMRVTAYMDGVYVGTNTKVASPPGTWPSATLSFTSPQPFNSVIVHYDQRPPTGGDWGPIFLADNVMVTPLIVVTGGWTGASSTNWADAGNWSGAVPGGTGGTTSTDTATFNHAAVYSPLALGVGRNLQNIVFDTADVNSLTIGATGGPSFHLTAGATVQTTASVLNPQAVDAPLVLYGDATFTSGAVSSSAALSFGGSITPAATSTYTTLFLDGYNNGANTVSGAISDNGTSTIAVAKNGTGQWTLTGANSYSGATFVNAGALRLKVAAGNPSITAGAIAIVSPGAQLELAGAVSALGTSAGNRADVINDSSAPGLLVSGTSQIVGGIDGLGSVEVAAGGSLTSNHIIQDSLLVGGDATNLGVVTIAASDQFGNPLTLFGAGGAGLGLQLVVPEPSSVVLCILAITAGAIVLLRGKTHAGRDAA